nr:ribonuclease H-like domain, reverse transcriptase, RNA-dependent DNA polymerase [Tanacetum cinerariifolium]
DSSYGVNTQEGKGTTGIIFYYGESPISWSTQKQATVALSSCESEFIAATAAATQALWLQRLLSRLTNSDEEKITILVDNKSAIALMKNPVFHERSKHIDTKYHFIRECVERDDIQTTGKETLTGLAVEAAQKAIQMSKLEPDDVDLILNCSSTPESLFGGAAEVKSKDLDLWHVITKGDFQPIQNNPETKLDEVVLFEKQNDDLKKRLEKNNKAKLVIYNALPRKEYKRILMLKITEIKESKDLTSLSLDKLIGNLKVHEMIIKNDSEIVKAKGKRKSNASKPKKESSDEESLTSESEDEEECLKPPRDKNQKAFVEGSWSDNDEKDDEKVKDETCLMAQASSEACSEGNVVFDSNLCGNIFGKGYMLVEFIIQNKFFSYTLEEFGLILGNPTEGHSSFSNKWSLDNLAFSVPSGGRYQTTLPSPDEIKTYIQPDREETLPCTYHGETVDVEEN